MHYLSPYSVKLSTGILFLLSYNSSLSNFKKMFLHPKYTFTIGIFHNYGNQESSKTKMKTNIADTQVYPQVFSSVYSQSHHHVTVTRMWNFRMWLVQLISWTGLSTDCWEKCTRVSAVSPLVQLYKENNQTANHEHAWYRWGTFKGLLLLSFCLT